MFTESILGQETIKTDRLSAIRFDIKSPKPYIVSLKTSSWDLPGVTLTTTGFIQVVLMGRQGELWMYYIGRSMAFLLFIICLSVSCKAMIEGRPSKAL